MGDKNRGSFLLFFIIFLTSFLLGFNISLKITQNSTSEVLKTQIEDNKSGITKELDLTKFWKVYNTIKDKGYDLGGISEEKIVDGAISGMVDSFGDKHTSFFNKEENKQFNSDLNGDFEGIGAVVEINPLGVKIDRIIKGSPAKKYGLISGDIIIKANGEKLEGLKLFDAVGKIKGPAGTKVELEILRSGEGELLNIEVIREKISIPSVSSEDLGDIAYISLNMFGLNTAEEFQKEYEKYKNKKGLIIDLRDNGGGYLISAVQILSHFIENGKTLVVTKNRTIFGNAKYDSLNDGDLYEGKLVVLINENSASASEIVSGALSDYKKAILVGKKSYGKGSVQEPFELGDGSMLKLTIAKWFTPNDINIDKEGISPDIEISFEKEDFKNNYDRQKEEAKKVLNKFIEIDAFGLTIDKYKQEEKN